MRRTRIVCTLGPASESEEILRALIRAGMDVARINFSHGDHPAHASRIERVRRIARQENANVALLADLQGPKIRVGNIVNNSATLVPDATFTLTTRAVSGDAACVSMDFPDLPRVVQPGSRILLSDGLLELRVESTSAPDVVTRVISGGELTPHKGVNLPGASFAIAAIPEAVVRPRRADAPVSQEVHLPLARPVTEGSERVDRQLDPGLQVEGMHGGHVTSPAMNWGRLRPPRSSKITSAP